MSHTPQKVVLIVSKELHYVLLYYCIIMYYSLLKRLNWALHFTTNKLLMTLYNGRRLAMLLFSIPEK